MKYLVYSMQNFSIKNFTDLVAWQKARDFAVEIYRTTEKFPRSEIYGLSSQLRRAAISVSSNIAEGFSRNTSNDKNHFYAIAKGSLSEIESQLLIARELGYANIENLNDTMGKKVELGKLLSGLIKSSQNRR
jgi:four helix bundle protein